MYYGCKKEIVDKRDYKMFISSVKSTIYPNRYEITIPSVKDQGIVNSCVAHTLASFLEEVHKNENIQFSTGFIYGYRPVGYSQDQGMFPRQAVKTLLKVGDVPKEAFDHNKEIPEIKKLVDNNLDELKDLASKYKIQSYARIYTKQDIMNCLYNDIAVLLVGWNEKGYILQNSWGLYWADNGRAILPFDYPIDSAWAISTDDNNVYTYTTIWQKIYTLILKIINKFLK